MGAWGCNIFQNDAALDWLLELQETVGFSLVDNTFDVVMNQADSYLDVDDGSRGLAACEVIARLKGAGGVPVEQLDEWVAKPRPVVDEERVARALAVIDRIVGSSSEVAELWDGIPEWRAAVDDLRRRVAG